MIVFPIDFKKLLYVSNLMKVYAIIIYPLVPNYNQRSLENLKTIHQIVHEHPWLRVLFSIIILSKKAFAQDTCYWPDRTLVKESQV